MMNYSSSRIAISGFILLFFASFTLFAQSESESETKTWFHQDLEVDGHVGVSTLKAYNDLLKEKKAKKKVVVAILDSGIDTDHEDLKDKIWVNKDEIPGNGKDDDNNGYVDDINGWNFLGNSKGENIINETLEITRLYREYGEKFEGKEEDEIEKSARDSFERYILLEEVYKNGLNEAQQQYQQMKGMLTAMNKADSLFKVWTGKEDYTFKDVNSYEPESDEEKSIKQILMVLMVSGLTEESIMETADYFYKQMNYHYNPDFNPRSIIDDKKLETPYYGNGDVVAEDNAHGTHVAGIIGAIRGNDIGLDGIADNVELMAVRVVPNGDERDQDVANGIRYAVDNGADVINMSFGKSYSPNTKLVWDAMKYAEEKGALLIHAAGNDAADLDEDPNYPTNYDGRKEVVDAWITVGASYKDKDATLPAAFSNYGKKKVDLFAPGQEIYSTLPDDKYGNQNGTSMAAPVVSGVAALVWSRYPELSNIELKEILMDNVTELKKLEVQIPNEQQEVDTTKFKKLCRSNGVVNVFKALQAAEEETKG